MGSQLLPSLRNEICSLECTLVRGECAQHHSHNDLALLLHTNGMKQLRRHHVIECLLVRLGTPLPNLFLALLEDVACFGISDNKA